MHGYLTSYHLTLFVWWHIAFLFEIKINVQCLFLHYSFCFSFFFSNFDAICNTEILTSSRIILYFGMVCFMPNCRISLLLTALGRSSKFSYFNMLYIYLFIYVLFGTMNNLKEQEKIANSQCFHCSADKLNSQRLASWWMFYFDAHTKKNRFRFETEAECNLGMACHHCSQFSILAFITV